MGKDKEKEWNGYTTYVPEEFKKSDATSEAEKKKNQANTDYETLVNQGVDSQYKDLMDQYLNKYLNREDFSYDFNTDALYQQYKDKYIKQGKMAMQDTIGQASAMTGGYGNSYAATVGNQAYQASLENLNDIIPELYQMAYDRYNQKGQDMLNQYSLASDAYSRDYGEYMDKLGILDSDRNYWGTEADNAFNRDWGIYTDNRNFEQSEHQTEQGYLYQDSRDKKTDEQWLADYDLKKRSQELAEEQWEYKKNQPNDTTNDNGGGNNTPVVDDEPVLEPKETKNTNSFIANHQTKDEFMARGDKSYDEYKEYIENSLEEGMKLGIYSFTDEELAYIVQYYGLS